MINESILLTLGKDGVAEVYDDTWDITIHCTSEAEQKKSIEMLKNAQSWIPVEENVPSNEEYVLVSFENFTIPDIGRYTVDDDGGGAFYPGDDDKSYVSYGLFVNAWMPLPEPYKEE